MRYYSGAYGLVAGRPAWVARTGYTGEDGFEIFCANDDCEPIWDALAVGRARYTMLCAPDGGILDDPVDPTVQIHDPDVIAQALHDLGRQS